MKTNKNTIVTYILGLSIATIIIAADIIGLINLTTQ